jgi:hypothetical protein
MAKNISEIYKEYKIFPALQEHMFRVAAVAYLICGNFNEPLPKEEIVLACLLHDMGNIIKIDLDVFPKCFEQEGIDYWQKVKDDYIAKYGTNEHKANVLIARELGFPKEIIDMVDRFDFSHACKYASGDNMVHKVINYADWRVDPHGIVSYHERQEEAKKRYQNRPDSIGGEAREKLRVCGNEVEKQIFSKCKIKPEDINDQTAAAVILELRNFVVK